MPIVATDRQKARSHAGLRARWGDDPPKSALARGRKHADECLLRGDLFRT